MHLRALVTVLAIGSVGFVAGRTTRSSPELAEPAPAPTCAKVAPALVVVPAPSEPAVAPLEPEPEPEPEPESGIDLGAALARADEVTKPLRETHNAIVGRVVAVDDDQPLAGVTVIVSSPGITGERVAISDEHGAFELLDLPSATYRLTFYYSDIAIERDGVAVSTLDATHLEQRLDPNAGTAWTGNVYIEDIPVPGRTFESTLGAADEPFE